MRYNPLTKTLAEDVKNPKAFYTQRRGVIYVHVDYKLVGKFNSKEKAREAGYDIDKAIPFNENFETNDASANIEFLIQDEKEAILGYQKEMSKTQDEKLINLFKHIVSEEQEHIEELEKAKQGIFESLE